MRTFPKSLAAFRKIVDERGQQLRNLTQEELKKIRVAPLAQLTVESRPATIGIIVQPKPDGSLRVIIQGFMKAGFVPGRHATLDGFNKHPDGTASATSASVEPGLSYRNSWAAKGVVGLKSLERRDDWMDFAGDRSNATDSET